MPGSQSGFLIQIYNPRHKSRDLGKTSEYRYLLIELPFILCVFVPDRYDLVCGRVPDPFKQSLNRFGQRQ